MDQIQAVSFLNSEENKEAIKLLYKRIKSLDSVRDCVGCTELEARKMAINLIEDWISEILHIKKGEIKVEDEDEEDLIKEID